MYSHSDSFFMPFCIAAEQNKSKKMKPTPPLHICILTQK